jgi:hypothetical protein
MRRWLTAGALGLLLGWGQTAWTQEGTQIMPALTVSNGNGAAPVTPAHAEAPTACSNGVCPSCGGCKGRCGCRRGFLQRLRDWLSYHAQRAGPACRGCAPKCDAGCWAPPGAYLWNRYDHGHVNVPQAAVAPPAAAAAETTGIQAVPLPQPYPPMPFEASTPRQSIQPRNPPAESQPYAPNPGVLQLPPLTPRTP